MDTFRCNYCGYETTDKGRFVRTQTDGDHCWLEMTCPQCTSTPAPVALVGESPFKSEPKWGLEETNYGLYVWHEFANGSRCSSPMIREHQLADAPASFLPGGEGIIAFKGTLWDVHQRLVRDGKARGDAFHAECRHIEDCWPPGETRQAEVDAARKRNHVGPYYTRVIHDGPSLMRKLPRQGRWVAA
jgi:hypothetical protein